MNEAKPKVSVIIPCYNQRHYLDDAVASVLAQTYQNFEIIIVNDGSTDEKTLEILKNYNKPKTHIIHTLNQGVSAARNTGIAAAKGEYILPLDADDKIGLTYLEKAVALLENDEKLGIVYCEAEFFGERQGKFELPNYSFPEILLCNVIPNSAFFRKYDWEAVKGYNPNMIYGWEDYDFWLSLIEIDKTVFRIPEVLYFYRQLQDSRSTLANKNSANSYTQLFKNHNQLYIRHIDVVFQHLVDLKEQRDRTVVQLQQTQVELQQIQEQFQAELQQFQIELQRSQAELQHTHLQLQAAYSTIAAMENTKFWKLRKAWLQFKKIIGLAADRQTREKARSLSSVVLGENRQAGTLHTAQNQSKPDAGIAKKGSWRYSRLFLRVKQLYALFKAGGFRPVSVKLLKKITQKLDSTIAPDETLQEIPHSEDIDYQQWLNKNYPRPSDLRKMAEIVELLSYKPVISVIMPVFNPPEYFLREAIESVLNQVYPYWDLCIADDASTQPYVKAILKEYLEKYPQIKVVFRDENGHISRASNSALEMATGEFVALLDHDDVLTPDALYEVAFLLNRHPEADMIYSDEDKIQEDGKLREPFFKPDWCPDSFLSRMYTAHLGVYRRSLLNDIGGFRVGYEGSQDYDLVLRLTEKTQNIFHIPKILYHWRIHPESTASHLSNKSYSTDAAQKALSEALERRGEFGRVIPVPGGHHIVRYEIKDFNLVSIIIPTKNLGHLLDKCLNSIFEKTEYPNYEVLVIDNGSTEAKTQEVFKQWKLREPNRFRCEALDIPFNFSRINNLAVNYAKGEYLLFLNNDTEVLTPDWISAMVEQAQRPSIGAVGALLLYPDKTIQHAGVALGVGGVAGHSHKHSPSSSNGYFNQIQTINNYSAVTAACLMCRREVFDAVGGFDETLSVAFNDVDLCIKIAEKGYRNIYLPHVVLYHYESKSRGYEDTLEKQIRFTKEIQYMQTKWKKFIEHDPCYSINLTKIREDYSINI